LQIHHIRDGDAFLELADIFYAQGYRYGGLLFNFPVPPSQGLAHVDFSPSDLLVIATRPPLDDNRLFDRLWIERSGSDLEQKVLDAIRPYFKTCKRDLVILSEEMAGKLKDPTRAEMAFHVHGPACYIRYRNHYGKNRDETRWHNSGEVKRTAAFFLSTKLHDNSLTISTAFSMDGPGTLIWCYLLRTRFSKLLTSDRFVVAEITNPIPPERPLTLSFADALKVEILLNHSTT
jgi:hypothetical protein